MKDKKVSDLIKEKGPTIYSIEDNKSIAEAAALMNTKKLGSLMVVDASGKYIGIVTERDLLTHFGSCGEDPCSSPVKDLMTKDLICIEENDTLNQAMNIMTKNKIRHLPVVSEKKVVGLISIGDVVDFIRTGLESETKYLTDYITDQYPR
jgi:CBS domain-containing protein